MINTGIRIQDGRGIALSGNDPFHEAHVLILLLVRNVASKCPDMCMREAQQLQKPQRPALLALPENSQLIVFG